MPNHSIRPGAYLLVLVALLLLTGTTVAVSQLSLGPWHLAAGLAIAGIKALLVLLFFMHVWFSNRLVRIVAVSGVFWLAILIGLTLSDYLTRGW